VVFFFLLFKKQLYPFRLRVKSSLKAGKPWGRRKGGGGGREREI